ncbi:MAG TPA: hypothetical protein VF030_05145 [Solirubrobacterales bacterium]
MRLRGAHFLLIAALAASAALLFSYVSRLSFIGDEWQLMISRPDWDAGAFLEPFNENLVVGIVVVYKTGLALFGMDSALPFYVVSILLFLLSAVLLFFYLERRVGAWMAAVGATLVLFLGAAYEDLFWAFQMGFFGSTAAGLGALLALDREDRIGDRLACGLLLVSLAFGSVGLAFLAAGLADLAFGRKPRRRRAYITVVPLLAYAVWWLGWGQSAGDQIDFDSILRTPGYVFDAAAGGLVSLLGREPIDADGSPPLIAQALLVVLIFCAGFRLHRQGELSRGMTVALALALSFWILIGLNRTVGDRFAISSRYQYPSAVFILIVAAELLRGVRVPRLAMAAVAIVAAAAVAAGITKMDEQFPGWKTSSDEIQLNLSALEISRPVVPPDFAVPLPPSTHSTAAAYFAAVDRFGSPVYDEAELLALPEEERRYVDRKLAEAMGIELAGLGDGLRTTACRTIDPAAPATEFSTGSFTLVNNNPEPIKARLARFADVTAVGLGRIPAGAGRSFTIPADASDRRWRLAALGGPLRLCRAHPIAGSA